MCTLLIATGVFDGPGLYVISNRDEALDRPARPPAVHRCGSMEILAPVDVQGGGTWIGLNGAGVFVGITNRFGLSTEAHHESRGRLVFDALCATSAADAARAMGSVSPHRHNGFHLVVADQDEAYALWNDGRSIETLILNPGYHVVTERSFDAAFSARLERMENRLSRLGAWTDNYRERFQSWMREHDSKAPLEGTCIHLDGANYGTRSSTIVELGAVRRFAHAAGPPCTTAYREYTDEVSTLRQSASTE